MNEVCKFHQNLSKDLSKMVLKFKQTRATWLSRVQIYHTEKQLLVDEQKLIGTF